MSGDNDFGSFCADCDDCKWLWNDATKFWDSLGQNKETSSVELVIAVVTPPREC